MAHNVTGANLQDIYDRMNGVDEYHPLDANTFSDWSVEAGDVVKVTRGEEEYQSPVHSSKLVWKGTPQVTISSTGNKERDSVSKMSRKKYGRGGAAVRANEGIHSYVWNTESTIYSYVDQTATYITQGVEDVENQLGSAILQTASQIRSEVHAANSELYSYVDQTATYIRHEVANTESGLRSSITQTAENIMSSVSASNSTIYSFIDQTATSITSRVEDVNEDLHTEILQTQSMIRSAVWTANSQVYSYVDQTASYILDHVGERSGAKVFTGTEEPVDTPENPITPGDLWLDGNYINFWDDADFQYVSYDPDEPEYDWTQLRGSKLKVWKDGEWQLAEDNTTLAEDTDLRRTKDQINLVAHNLIQTDGELRSNIARIDVKADRIVSTVNERIADVGSNITQTAYQIRAEVHAVDSKLYSAIEQTATNIRSYVVDAVNDIGSEILQTASQIRSEVHAAKSTLYSYVDQTATYIRSVVADTANGLSSAITQTASEIRSEVSDSVGGLSSRISQTASAIRQEVANTESSLRGSITVESNRISLVVEGTGANAKIKPASIVSAINDGSSSIVISADHINLDGYVKATQLTTGWLDSLIADISVVRAKGLTATNNVVAGGYTMAPVYYIGTPGNAHSFTDAVTSIRIVQSGNTYTLQGKTVAGGDTWWNVGTFSRAVSSMGVTRNGAVYTITPQPQGSPSITVGFSSSANIALEIVTNGTPTLDPMSSKWVVAPMKVQQLNGQAEPTEIVNFNKTIDATASYNAGHAKGILDYRSNVNGYWKKPSENSGICTIPNDTNSGSETWFSMSPMSLTRVKTYVDTSGNASYYGKLYYYNAKTSKYEYASDSDRYYYISNSNRAGTTTVYY